MKIADLVRALEGIAPPSLAEGWDNVGLLVGDREAPLRGPTLLTIDLTESVMAEAERIRAGAIVAYHPPIFQPIRSVTAATSQGRVLLRAMSQGMAIYSPHTALDAVKGGVTDWLADGIGAGDRKALVAAPCKDPRQTHKIVTFVPAGDVERVRNALASAGAGHIGNYSLCSFETPGAGTFFGEESSNPRVGQAGRLERVEEVRLEMVCPGEATPILIETLRAFHPYEEPAFDVYELAGRPDRSVGAGRRLVLDQPATPEALASRLRDYLGINAVRLAEVSPAPVQSVGICPGAGSSLLDAAIGAGCELFITGEMRHHEMLGAMSRGCGVILAGHTNTERGYLPLLAERIRAERAGLEPVVSEADRRPWRPV